MLLISIGQILFWLSCTIVILVILLSLRGILSPKFSILLLMFFGGASILVSFLSTPKSEPQLEKQPSTVVNDTSHIDSTRHNEESLEAIEKPIKEKQNNSPENEKDRVNDEPITQRSIPQEYEVIDTKLRTYQVNGPWGLGKPFVEYFERETGWRKRRKGNYEIEIKPTGHFTEEDGMDTRIYIHSGGDVEIKVNGKACCCKTIFSIPKGINDSKLVKAQEKLKNTISDLILDNKEKVVMQLRACL